MPLLITIGFGITIIVFADGAFKFVGVAVLGFAFWATGNA